VEEPLLRVEGLRTCFRTEDGVVPAVDGVGFSVGRGETLGLVGESGCGKTVAALSVMGLVPSPPGRVEAGRVLFRGEDLLRAGEARMRRLRGGDVAMIFQEPMTALNPFHAAGRQVAEALRLHAGLGARAAAARAAEMFRLVGVPSPERRLRELPHRMSGGMRQRVMIAMALACGPALLIADEPTTALDTTIQAQILDLMRRLQRATGMAILLITHDLGVVADMCDRVAVMYAGRVVEQADAPRLFQRPLHPYTAGLLRSTPRLDGRPRSRLHVIPGTVPDLARLPAGCRFADRCPHVRDACRAGEPPLEDAGDGRLVACWRHAEIDARGVA
jgi:oligopeptide transport system ATP-binding protein